MKYYLIAGEASGDLHGGNLINALKAKDSKAEFRCWGGDQMEAAGATLAKHYKEHAYMGFIEVIKNLGAIKKNFKTIEKELEDYYPDVLILIDYSGFNLRVAKIAKKLGLKVFYYICPQIWAWRQGRAKKIKKYVDRAFCILPFEEQFYEKYDYQATYVGHPLVDHIEKQPIISKEEFCAKHNLPIDKRLVALLPGSRKQELLSKLPIMLKLPEHFEGEHFVIAATKAVDQQLYQVGQLPANVSIVNDDTYGLLQNATAGVITSGTATVEAALFRIPQVVCYKTDNLTYKIVKNLVNIKFISIVNLIMEREVIKELIQDDLSETNLINELGMLLNDLPYRNNMLDTYEKFFKLLGGGGATDKAATMMIEALQNK